MNYCSVGIDSNNCSVPKGSSEYVPEDYTGRSLATPGGYSVYPYYIYENKTVYPTAYYSYEPKGPSERLVYPANKDINPYGKSSRYGRMFYPNGYGEGNLIGHTCDCECEKLQAGYGPMTGNSCCWCGCNNYNKFCTQFDGKPVKEENGCAECIAVDVSKVKLR